MTDEKEIKDLIRQAEALGATITRTRDEEAFREEGRDLTETITVSGVPGFGPCPMSPIFAAERLREFVYQKNARNFRREDIPVEVIFSNPSRRDVFPDFAAAKAVFPDLDLHHQTKRFTWAMRGADPKTGATMARFESWETYPALSGD